MNRNKYGQTYRTLHGEAYKQGRRDAALAILVGVLVGITLGWLAFQGYENTRHANDQWCTVTGTDC